MGEVATMSLYEVLELPQGASREQIEASYRRINGFLGPDRLAMVARFDDETTARLRAQVFEAYQTLSDPSRRAAYDRRCAPAAPAHPVGRAAPVAPAHGGARHASMAPAQGGARHASVASAHGGARHASVAPAHGGVRHASVAPAHGAAAAHAAVAPAARRRLRPALALAAEVAEEAEFSGATLRQLRESAGIALDEISELTKIGRRYLRALEDNDVELLPAPVYVRGFVNEYARALGLDPQRVTASYLAVHTRLCASR